ncbi:MULTISPECIES: hypothetical protein [Pyrobaculum]|uniref:hypothetical protein n=1 Tax=Pyrobaculum TaxID=2276 RepID=UPI000AF5D879
MVSLAGSSTGGEERRGEKHIPGVKMISVGGEELEVEEVDIMSIVPISSMLRLAALIGGEAVETTALALQLHRYQHNGPDPEGYFSDIPDDKTAATAICRIVSKIVQDNYYKKICEHRPNPTPP